MIKTFGGKLNGGLEKMKQEVSFCLLRSTRSEWKENMLSDDERMPLTVLFSSDGEDNRCLSPTSSSSSITFDCDMQVNNHHHHHLYQHHHNEFSTGVPSDSEAPPNQMEMVVGGGSSEEERDGHGDKTAVHHHQQQQGCTQPTNWFEAAASRAVEKGSSGLETLTRQECKISVKEFECGVTAGSGDSEKQEWSFTLYDFDGRGKVTKEDLATLMKSLYDVVGSNLRLQGTGPSSPRRGGGGGGASGRSFKLRLTVVPDSSQTTCSSSGVHPPASSGVDTTCPPFLLLGDEGGGNSGGGGPTSGGDAFSLAGTSFLNNPPPPPSRAGDGWCTRGEGSGETANTPATRSPLWSGGVSERQRKGTSAYIMSESGGGTSYPSPISGGKHSSASGKPSAADAGPTSLADTEPLMVVNSSQQQDSPRRHRHHRHRRRHSRSCDPPSNGTRNKTTTTAAGMLRKNSETSGVGGSNPVDASPSAPGGPSGFTPVESSPKRQGKGWRVTGSTAANMYMSTATATTAAHSHKQHSRNRHLRKDIAMQQVAEWLQRETLSSAKKSGTAGPINTQADISPLDGGRPAPVGLGPELFGSLAAAEVACGAGLDATELEAACGAAAGECETTGGGHHHRVIVHEHRHVHEHHHHYHYHHYHDT